MSERLPFNAWELVVIEQSLKFYADHYQGNSEITKRHTRNLADRISEALPREGNKFNKGSK